MIKWIKNLFASKRLKLANLRIQELEAEVSFLKTEISYLEDTFIPVPPNKEFEEQKATDKT